MNDKLKKLLLTFKSLSTLGESFVTINVTDLTIRFSYRKFCFCAFDGISNQAPGATGTDYRLNEGLDLMTLEFTHLLVTDLPHNGDKFKKLSVSFRCGDVAVVV